MSTNVSLANAGTSLNFDGQALQNQQEVEMEREEQQQQNELRQLLSDAFDDLDDDILASSEDESVNSSHICSHHDSVHVERAANSVSTPVTMATSTGLMSYPSGPVTHPLHLHSNLLRMSQEGSIGTGHDSPVPHPDQYQLGQVQEGQGWMDERADAQTPTDPDSVWGVRGNEGGLGLGGEVEVGKEPQHDVVDGASQSASMPYSFPASSAYLYTNSHNTTTTTTAAGLSSLPEFTNSPFPASTEVQYQDLDPIHHFAPPSSHADHFPFGAGGTGCGAKGGGGGGAAVTSLGWNTTLGTDSTTVVYPDHLLASQASHTQSTDPGTYPAYFTAPHSDANPLGWHRAPTVSSNSAQGTDATSAAYPLYATTPHPGMEPMGGWEVGDRGANILWGRQGGGVMEQQVGALTGQEEDDFDHYTVTYKKRQLSNTQPATSTASDLKVNFITQEGDNEEVSRLAQLQMLYQSRGRQLEDLRGELDKMTQESAKERRMLKHLLSVSTVPAEEHVPPGLVFYPT